MPCPVKKKMVETLQSKATIEMLKREWEWRVKRWKEIYG